MTLAPGTRLGPYEIGAPLGAGGMGEVYRARDTRLDRTVAIKVLPQKLSNDPVQKQRFEREAKTISSLNHPHICVLHDIGQEDALDYLVMEYVEGETLAKRLEKGPLPLDQALKYGVQISDALRKAHRAGIVHRDLKPGNIMLTANGAKLLDFGLAKPVARLVSELTLTAAATQPSPITQEGTIVGTFQYMSPEQIEGKEVDGRSDIFSLGAVLYEMVTGKRAFAGKSQLSVASAILEKEPEPIAALRPLTPPALDRTIRKCLAKDPEQRWQNAADLAGELGWIAEGGTQSGRPTEASRPPLWRRLAWGAVALGVVAAVFAIGYFTHQQPEPKVLRASIPPPEKARFAPIGISGGPAAVSPDGKLLAFAARDDSGEQLLWVHSLESGSSRPLQATQGASYPFWSPDSHSIAFFSGGKLKKVEAFGGPVQSICDAANGRGGTWNKQGVILFAPTIDGPLFRVSDSGGTPVVQTKLDESVSAHRWPYFLPDGRHFLYFSRGKTTGIYAGSLDSPQTKLIVSSEANAAFSSGGQLLWWREGSLMAQGFDANSLELRGSAIQVADHVLFTATQSYAVFSLSQNGILVLQSGGTVSGNQLAWFDRSGKQLDKFVIEQANISHPRISPDGQKIAATSVDSSGGAKDLWIYDLARRVNMRFTLSQSASDAVWSPDGTRIAYASNDTTGASLLVKPTIGAAGEEVLLHTTGVVRPWSWSADGRFIAYMYHATSTVTDKFDIWILPLAGDRKPFPFLQSAYEKDAPSFSPDGRWIAYSSTESGLSEVYLAAFPEARTKLQVSSQGGFSPVWRTDGKELYYVSLGGQLTAVSVSGGGAGLRLEKPIPLFTTDFTLSRGGNPIFQRQPFDVSPKDQRFLITSSVDSSKSSDVLTVIVNWDAALKK